MSLDEKIIWLEGSKVVWSKDLKQSIKEFGVDACSCSDYNPKCRVCVALLKHFGEGLI